MRYSSSCAVLGRKSSKKIRVGAPPVSCAIGTATHRQPTEHA
jgi:hypothetical protein